MNSEKLDQLFAQELALYTDLDKLIAEYIQPLQSEVLSLSSDLPTLKADLLHQIKQKRQEIKNLYEKQIQEMRLLCNDEGFKTKHPLFFQFVSQCIDFSRLPTDSDIQYLCYLSTYKLLSRETGNNLITELQTHLVKSAKKIKMHLTKDDSMRIKELEFYHPDIDRCNRLYISAGKDSNLVPRLIFISFGHELIHLLHHLSGIRFQPKEASQYFRFPLAQPKCWLYMSTFENPEKSKQPHEYITIEGRNDILNGLCENRLRAAYGLPSREAWRAINIEDSDARLTQYFFLTKKLAKSESLSFTETEELRFSKADGTLPAFYQRHRNKAKAIETKITTETRETSSIYRYCTIL